MYSAINSTIIVFIRQQVGDQILDVNGKSFRDITHKQVRITIHQGAFIPCTVQEKF